MCWVYHLISLVRLDICSDLVQRPLPRVRWLVEGFAHERTKERLPIGRSALTC
jgi:hypothetical protein